MIDISYDTLFSVELLHKYSADGICNDFTIVPSAATKQLLSNYRIIVKQYGNILNAWIQLDPDGLALVPSIKKPFIIPQEGLQLTFFLLLNNPLFFNYTGIQAANSNGNIYYFSNRNGNSSNNKNFLTSSLNHLAPTYSVEDLIVKGGSVYQSLKDKNSDALNNMNSWRQVMYPDPNNPGSNIPDPNRFMSAGDSLTWMPSVSQFAPDTATNIEIKDYKGNSLYTKTIKPSYPLDLSDLKAGKYLLIIGANPQTSIYLNDELNNAQVFGVIDIFIESTLDINYLILNQDTAHKNELISPPYSIYFINKATIWKYILTSTNNSAEITDSSHIYQFSQPATPTSPTTILSQFSIPLSETPLTTLTLDGKSPPCATADRLSKNTEDVTDTHYYSEIFLNY